MPITPFHVSAIETPEPIRGVALAGIIKGMTSRRATLPPEIVQVSVLERFDLFSGRGGVT
jgi:hypothetical protein